MKESAKKIVYSFYFKIIDFIPLWFKVYFSRKYVSYKKIN